MNAKQEAKVKSNRSIIVWVCCSIYANVANQNGIEGQLIVGYKRL